MPVSDFVQADLERYRKFADEFKSESDRGCAVLVMCVLEDSLRALIGRVVADPGSDLRNFAPRGRLAVAIDSAVLLGQLSQREAVCFRKLAGIRNAFAHKALLKLTFDASPIADHCRDLEMPISSSAWPERPADLTHRQKFLMASAMLQIAISVRTEHAARLQQASDV